MKKEYVNVHYIDLRNPKKKIMNYVALRLSQRGYNGALAPPPLNTYPVME